MSRPIICPACLTQGLARRRPVAGTLLVVAGVAGFLLGIVSVASERRVADVRMETEIRQSYENALRGEKADLPAFGKSQGGAAPFIMYALGAASLIGGMLCFRYRSICAVCDGKAIPLLSPGGQVCLARTKAPKARGRTMSPGGTGISPDAKWG